MSDKIAKTDSINTDSEKITVGLDEKQPMIIHGQYIRDMSFENPNAPDSLRMDGTHPEMDINISMDARKVENEDIPDLYEVVIEVNASAKKGEKVLFIAELQYAMAVSFDSAVPEEERHPALLIEMPRMLFPYARQLLSDLTINGGFPPLMLNPVDFHALYMERFSDEIKKARSEFKEDLTKSVEESVEKAKSE